MIEFKLENGFKIDLEKSEKVFTPTGTTETIIEGILENNNEKRTTLDLGCGCGVIGLSLFKNGFNRSRRNTIYCYIERGKLPCNGS